MLPIDHRPRKYENRPEPCRVCGSPAWWNGTRTVSTVHASEDGVVEHDPESCRRRARCSSKSCDVGSWTVYEDADDYPHRLFGLDLVVSAVCMFVLGMETLTASAAAHLCSRDSVRRWARWVASLAEPRDLEQLCARLDPDGLPPPTGPARGGRAARVLVLLDRLADLMETRGVALRGRGCGLVRVLHDRLVRFGEVFFLTRASPPLRADPARLPL